MRTLIALAALALCNVAGASSLKLTANRANHFYVEARIGSVGVPMMIDTGATMLVLPRTAANQAGEYGSCKWVRNHTANGPIDTCLLVIREFSFGPWVFKDVKALITTDIAVGSHGLIGMDMLSRFRLVMHRGVLEISD